MWRRWTTQLWQAWKPSTLLVTSEKVYGLLHCALSLLADCDGMCGGAG